jgi:hypothetical protein
MKKDDSIWPRNATSSILEFNNARDNGREIEGRGGGGGGDNGVGSPDQNKRVDSRGGGEKRVPLKKPEFNLNFDNVHDRDDDDEEGNSYPNDTSARSRSKQSQQEPSSSFSTPHMQPPSSRTTTTNNSRGSPLNDLDHRSLNHHHTDDVNFQDFAILEACSPIQMEAVLAIGTSLEVCGGCVCVVDVFVCVERSCCLFSCMWSLFF